MPSVLFTSVQPHEPIASTGVESSPEVPNYTQVRVIYPASQKIGGFGSSIEVAQTTTASNEMGINRGHPNRQAPGEKTKPTVSPTPPRSRHGHMIASTLHKFILLPAPAYQKSNSDQHETQPLSHHYHLPPLPSDRRTRASAHRCSPRNNRTYSFDSSRSGELSVCELSNVYKCMPIRPYLAPPKLPPFFTTTLSGSDILVPGLQRPALKTPPCPSPPVLCSPCPTPCPPSLDTSTITPHPTQGGVANLNPSSSSSSSSSPDLAANAETQGLRAYAREKSLRLLLVIVEASYRLAALNTSSTSPSILTASSLRGKRIGTSSGVSSAGYFVEKYLSQVGGLKRGEYTVVSSGGTCSQLPCGRDTQAGMFARGAIDAIGMWEPIVELAIQTAGREKVVVFQDKSVYREIYSLYSTRSKLEDPERRASIVEFVRGLVKMQKVFEGEPEKVFGRVAAASKVEEGVIRTVWKDHSWKGGLPGDLVDFLVEEDRYLARVENRAVMTKEEIERFVDPSVLKEALAA